MQAINAIIQIAGIPLLLKYWGVNYYGEWLILFTIPSYIGMSDMGLGSSTTSELSILIQAGEEAEAREILRNTFWFILLIGGLPFLILALSVFTLPWYDWLNFAAIVEGDFKVTFILLILYIYLALFLTLPLGYYRVRKIYHRERYISSFFRVLEFLLIVAAVMAGSKIVIVALIYLLVRMLQFTFVLFDLTLKFREFRLLPFGFNFKKISYLLKPGLSAMTIYLGQNLMTQGLVSIIGIALGSAQVVLFSTTRTLINMVKQVVGIINLSITSEFSYSFGARDFPLLRKLFRITNRVNAIIAFGMLTLLYFFGHWIFKVWTGGKVEIIEPFFLLFLVGTLFSSVWNVRLVLLVATNKLGYSGIMFLVNAVLLIVLNAFLIGYWGLTGMAISILVFELAMWIIMSNTTRGLLRTDTIGTPIAQ